MERDLLAWLELVEIDDPKDGVFLGRPAIVQEHEDLLLLLILIIPDL